MLTVGDFHADKGVARHEFNGFFALAERILEFAKRCLFHIAVSRCHKDKAIFIKAMDRQNDANLFIVLKLQEVNDGFPFTRSCGLGHQVHGQLENAALVAKAQHLIVGIGHEKALDGIAFACLRGSLTLSAALLFSVLI